MFSLIKYELKGRWKFYVGSFASYVLLYLFLKIGFTFWWKSKGNGDVAAFTALIAFLGFFVASIDCINILRRELFNETGYLLFVLPQKGYSILGAKIATCVIQQALFGFFGLILIFIEGLNFIDFREILANINLIFNAVPQILYFLGNVVWIQISLLILIAFSLVLAKSLFVRRKFGNAASFATFVATVFAIGFIDNKLQKIFPYNISLGELQFGWFNLDLLYRNINVASLLFTLVLPIVLFAATSYLLENKMEVR